MVGLLRVDEPTRSPDLLPGEEGRGFSRDLLLLLQPRVLAPKLAQLLTLVTRHTVIALAMIDVVLLEPVTQT
jgi:hypothetical protein